MSDIAEDLREDYEYCLRNPADRYSKCNQYVADCLIERISRAEARVAELEAVSSAKTKMVETLKAETAALKCELNLRVPFAVFGQMEAENKRLIEQRENIRTHFRCVYCLAVIERPESDEETKQIAIKHVTVDCPESPLRKLEAENKRLRGEPTPGAAMNALMEEESKQSLAQLYLEAIGREKRLRECVVVACRSGKFGNPEAAASKIIETSIPREEAKHG